MIDTIDAMIYIDNILCYLIYIYNIYELDYYFSEFFT